ncbi:MAG: RNA-binding S4 domain-containing protein [Christensenellales bacterium]|jgi:ribosomal 50S subunit-recycling heat shock protein|nr:RNA-binding S4 domain-containing protein [Christensenellaceae bacterium]
MRLDKFLKTSRIIKRRTLAKEACDTGRVSINGKIAKAGAEVKEGDKIELRLASRSVQYEVLSLKEAIRKDEAIHMYRIINKEG